MWSRAYGHNAETLIFKTFCYSVPTFVLSKPLTDFLEIT